MIILFLHFFVSILVPGIEESTPNTEDKIFQILLEPDIVESFTFLPDQGLFFTITADAKQESLLIKIPKNFPILTTRQEFLFYDDMMAISDGMEILAKISEGKCFLSYDIPLQNSSNVELLYTYPLINEPYITSRTVDTFCYIIYENPPPTKDCLLDYENHINRRGQSVCVFSVEELFARGYLV